MSGLRFALRSAILAVQVAAAWVLILGIAGPAAADSILINNGLAPPNPENVQCFPSFV